MREYNLIMITQNLILTLYVKVWPAYKIMRVMYVRQWCSIIIKLQIHILQWGWGGGGLCHSVASYCHNNYSPKDLRQDAQGKGGIL